MNKVKLRLLLSMVCFCCHTLIAQETKSPKISPSHIGFIYGYGDQSLLAVNYDYRVAFFQPQLYYTILDRSNWNLELLLQPQYNLTEFRQVDFLPDESEGFELGLNVGVLLRKNLLKDIVSVYILGSIGPHYVSGVPKRQSTGFIFSDNFFLGLSLKISSRVYLDLRPGIRHISNAGLQERNGGVNNTILSGGIYIKLNR
ncbi:MAG: acyloxyacyl hydrolase [Bacteroidota bacterium]